MVPQASTKCGLLPPTTNKSVAMRATASIRNRCLALSPHSQSHRSLHRYQRKERKGPDTIVHPLLYSIFEQGNIPRLGFPLQLKIFSTGGSKP